jgi:beta-hydroxyacyl-ACP dehydratase FabZ
MILDVNDIQRMLPHRYPFLLIDRVVEIEPGKSIAALKNVTINESFFQGHFPGKPIMPGVLQIEALAQAGGVLVYKSVQTDDNIVYFMSIDKVKFRKPVVPGDQLRLEVSFTQARGKVYRFKGQALVDGQVVCQAEFMAMTARE